MRDRYTSNLKLNGKTYKFHDSISQERLKTVEQQLNKTLNGFFGNRVYGEIRDNNEKFYRKIINALIRAKNKPINKDLTEIKVKLSDREIKIKPILYKH